MAATRLRACGAALRRSEIPDGWPLIGFATKPGMVTADGAVDGLMAEMWTDQQNQPSH
jgi:hypothetical protein